MNVRKFLDSTLGGAVFRSSSGFRQEMFGTGLGLPITQMSQYVRAESLKHNWVFNVIQMFPTFTVRADLMKAKLGGQKGPKSPISGHDYFLVRANEVMDGLSAIDFFSILNPKASPDRPLPKTTMAWHIYDGRTLVIAEVSQMEQFLQSGRKPKQLTQYQDMGSRSRGPTGYGTGGSSPRSPMPGAAPVHPRRDPRDRCRTSRGPHREPARRAADPAPLAPWEAAGSTPKSPPT